MFFKRSVSLNLVFQPPQDQVLLLTQRVAELTQELDRLKTMISGATLGFSSDVPESMKKILLLVNLPITRDPSLSFPEIPTSLNSLVRISASIYTSISSTNNQLVPTIAPHPIEFHDHLHQTIIDLRYEPDGPHALYWGDGSIQFS